MLQRYVPRFPYLPCRKVTDKNRPDLRPTMHSNRCNRRDRTLNFIVCARKKKKKKKKEGRKKRKGGTEMWRIGWRRKWLHRDYRGNEELYCKRVVSNYKITLYSCVVSFFFFTFYRVIRYQRYQFFQSLTSVSFDPLCICDPTIL